MRRFFVGDEYGRLALLTVTDSPELLLVPIGEVCGLYCHIETSISPLYI